MLLFFGLTSYPGEIAYFNSPIGELSNGRIEIEMLIPLYSGAYA